MNNKDLLTEAGFQVFGEKIVAGDFGSSGNATLCAQKLIALVVAQCVGVCEAQAAAKLAARLDTDDFTEKNRLAMGEAIADKIAKDIKEKFGGF